MQGRQWYNRLAYSAFIQCNFWTPHAQWIFPLLEWENCWLKESSTTDKLIRLLQLYHMRLQGWTIDSPSSEPASQTAKQGKCSTSLKSIKKTDFLCHDGTHPLYLCVAFKAKSVKERYNTVSKLKICSTCLSWSHIFRDCPSSMSCTL